jgi:hypothetical protein
VALGITYVLSTMLDTWRLHLLNQVLDYVAYAGWYVACVTLLGRRIEDSTFWWKLTWCVAQAGTHRR